MSDKINFDKNGTYRRGGAPVESMDVNTGKVGATPSQEAAPPKVKSVGAPTPPKAFKPGSFNLSALRASAAQAGSTVTQTTLPEQGAVELKNMEQVPIDKKDEVPATSAQASAEFAPAPAEAPAIEPKVEEQSAPAEQSIEEVEGTTAEIPAELLDPPPVHDPASNPPIPAPAQKEPEPGMNLSKLRSATGTPEPPKASAEEPSKEAQEPVQEMTFSGEQQPPALEEKDKELGFTGEGFKISSLQDFCVHSGLGSGEIVRWCKKCVKAALSMPATILSWYGDPKVRFYNCIYGQSGDRVNAVLGCGDYIVCVAVDFRKNVHYEANQHIAIQGKDVVDKHGAYLAIYSERLRQSYTV